MGKGGRVHFHLGLLGKRANQQNNHMHAIKSQRYVALSLSCEALSLPRRSFVIGRLLGVLEIVKN